MKYTVKDRLEFIVDYSLDIIESLLRIIICPFYILWELLNIITHPFKWIWEYFQCEFIIDYYIRGKYHNTEYNTLLRYNINLNYPSRQEPTLRNKIYRWCTFKIFKRNNYTYDPNRKSSWIN